MSDEQTPEELEALRNLPRERMPSAKLEERVVGAMRERGMLSAKKTARVIRLTNSRVAGLIAASIVIVVGAYSIGLQRGDRGLQSSVQPPTDVVSPLVTRDETTPMVSAPQSREERAASELRQESEPRPAEMDTRARESTTMPEPKLDWKLNATEAETQPSPALKKELQAERIEPAPSSAVAEDMSTRADKDAGKLKSGTAAQPRAPQPKSDLRLSYGANSARVGASTAPSRRSFMLGNTALIVEAPDSVRIDTDSDGRTLLIYTSDGVIRIRLAD